MIETNVSRHHETFLQVIQSYYQLTKPRIIPLLLITTAGSMWIASSGHVDPFLLLVTLAGGTLAAASQNYPGNRKKATPIARFECAI